MSRASASARAAPCLLAMLVCGCAHPAPPVYLLSMRATSGPEPVLAVAASDVVGPPVRARGGAVTFLRPSRRGLDVVARFDRSDSLARDLDDGATYLLGAVGGREPWVAVSDAPWWPEHDPVATRGADGRRRRPLRGRDPVALTSGFVVREDDSLVAYADGNHRAWSRDLETAEPASCNGGNRRDQTAAHTVAPSGTRIAAARWSTVRAATCIETVVRLARLDADGAPLGSDVVLRYAPPDELWNASPDPDRYGTSAVALAARDDGTVLVALSIYQPATGSSSTADVIRLLTVTPEGEAHTLRTLPGRLDGLGVVGTSWLALVQRSASAEHTLIVLGDDGRQLADFAIPRRNVAMMSLQSHAFVAWRAAELAVCGMPLDAHGRRGRVVCRSLASLDAHPLRGER